MPVPTSITELSQTAGSNPPSGSDSPTVTDDHFRAAYSFIAELRDDKADSADAVLLTGNQTIAGVKTFSSTISGNISGNAAGTAANVTGTVAIANGGTGQTTASAAFGALKQAASDTATGVVELATSAEVQTGTDTARAITPAGFSAASLGYGQTWQLVTRTAGVTYTNSTGRPIMLVKNINGSGSASCSANIAFNGGSAITFVSSSAGTGPSGSAGSIIIPPGSTYVLGEVNVTSTNNYELR